MSEPTRVASTTRRPPALIVAPTTTVSNRRPRPSRSGVAVSELKRWLAGDHTGNNPYRHEAVEAAGGEGTGS